MSAKTHAPDVVFNHPEGGQMKGKAVALIVLIMGVMAAGASAASANPLTVCQTQTTAGTGWQVYRVCLSGVASFNGGAPSGGVTGVSCNIFAPTGTLLGYVCDPHDRSWGTYWNSRLGAVENWYNQRVYRISPYPPYSAFTNCVYLRTDTYPNGRTTYQNFANVNQNFWTTRC